MAEEAKSTGPVRMVAIDNMVENIRYKSQILVSDQTRLTRQSCIRPGRIYAGLLIALILIIVPALLLVVK